MTYPDSLGSAEPGSTLVWWQVRGAGGRVTLVGAPLSPLHNKKSFSLAEQISHIFLHSASGALISSLLESGLVVESSIQIEEGAGGGGEA